MERAKDGTGNDRQDRGGVKPEIYMPRLQLGVRYILVGVTAMYLNGSPLPPVFLTLTQVNLIIVGYMIFHAGWWWLYRKYGESVLLIRLGAWVDTIAAAVALMCDPFEIPPTAGLLLIATLGNGIQHGFGLFMECMVGAFVFGSAALVYHFIFMKNLPPYNLYLFVFLLNVAVFYAYLLVRRIERMKIEATINSERDALTGILNRRAFLKSAEYFLSLHQRTGLSLVFIFADLDQFKLVNDCFGHEVGDDVLRRFAQIAKACIRKNDIVARYGGDEFVILLTDTSLDYAGLVLERIRNEFKAWAVKRKLPVDVSFGVGTTLDGPNRLEDILRRVDASLYEAKKRSGNRR